MPRLTPAVLRALDVLELFVSHRGPLRGADVVRLTGHPRASVHELLVTLESRHYLVRERDGAYALGPAVLPLGNAYRDSLNLPELGQRVAQGVVDRHGETVNVGALAGGDVVYLVKVDSPHPVRLVSRLGGRLPAASTAIGKALLAWLPDDELDDLLAAPLHRLTPRTLTDPAAVRAQLAEVRASGIAFEKGESTPGVTCAAAPVRDETGKVVAALSVSVPDLRWAQQTADHWASVAREGADELSRALGLVD